MKVLRSDKPGGLNFTKEILDWLRKNRKNLDYVVDHELMKAIENEDIVTLKYTEKLRTHPLLIDAFSKFPNDSYVLDDVQGSYFKLISYDSGIETIISPALENFTEGYNQENSKALLEENKKSIMKNFKIERTENGVKIGENEITTFRVRVVKSDMTVKELKAGETLNILANNIKKVGRYNYVFEGSHLSILLD